MVDVTDKDLFGKIDHMVIAMKIVMGHRNEEEKLLTPEWCRADWNAMREKLLDIIWGDELAGMVTKMAWGTFVSSDELAGRARAQQKEKELEQTQVDEC